MTNEQVSAKVTELSNNAWAVANTIWTAFSKSDVGKIILPFMVLRRLDCLLENTKSQMLESAKTISPSATPEMRDRMLYKAAGLDLKIYNIAPFTLNQLKNQDPSQLYENLVDYINGFPPFLQDVFNERFGLPAKLKKMADKDKLYGVFEKICNMDLHPNVISNLQMGYLYEDLIRKFSEAANEDAGDHFTPREVVHLIAKLLLNNDREAIQGDGIIRTFYDGTCGTGGMLSVAEEEARNINPSMIVELYGQQLTDDGYAVCVTDMLLKGQDPLRIKLGDTLKNDQHADRKFHFCMANPPYGVEWKDAKEVIEAEHKNLGFNGRFGAGLPRISDAQLLFVQHFVSKFRDDEVGGRLGIVLNGSPLFTGGAGSGESEIRKWLLESDMIEGIIGLPTDMFYNTGISTYIWILNNRKHENRAGKVRLLDASSEEFWTPMRKSLGSKRKQLSAEAVERIVELFYGTALSPHVKDFYNQDFGYSTITVERPLKDEAGNIILGEKGKLKGKPQPDSSLRDTENVPLKENIQAYFEREVLPHVPDAWIDHEKTKVGYEIPFNRHFYNYVPPRPLEVIDAELKALSAEIMTILTEVTA
ncbi:MAG TPA: class I SAM-dependent DNA methyltransferase [Methylotenera sp.]